MTWKKGFYSKSSVKRKATEWRCRSRPEQFTWKAREETLFHVLQNFGWNTKLNVTQFLPCRKKASQNAGKLLCIRLYPILRHASVALIVLTAVFYIVWYKIVMQRSLILYHRMHHLWLVFSWYTHSPRCSCLYQKIQVTCAILYSIPLETLHNQYVKYIWLMKLLQSKVVYIW